jgi:hypothetical protein
MTQLHFNYKDVFRACRLGFSAKKIWVQFVGYLVALIGYNIFTYGAYVAAGTSISQVWANFRLFPFPAALPWFSWLIWAVGLLFVLIVLLMAGTAVSKITYEQLRGDEFYEIKEAWKFALKSGRAVIFSPVLLILFVAFLVFCGLILSLIGAIPYFGEIFVGIMAIPAFAVSLFIVYLVIVFLFNFLIGPAVVGTTKSDTFDTLFEVFSCVNEQPWRLVTYGGILKILTAVSTFILGLATAGAVQVGSLVLKVFMRGKVDDIIANAASYVRINLPAWCPGIMQTVTTKALKLVGLGPNLEPSVYVSLGWSRDVASILVGITFYLIILFVLSYGEAVWFSGYTVIYTVLVRKKDDKNLLEVKEEKEEKTEELKPEEKPVEQPAELKPKRPASRRKKE